MNTHVGWVVGQSVASVCHNFLKRLESFTSISSQQARPLILNIHWVSTTSTTTTATADRDPMDRRADMGVMIAGECFKGFAVIFAFIRSISLN